MTKFYVDPAGNYLGGYDGAEPPAGAIEIVAPPDRATDLWTGAAWIQYRSIEERNAPILAALEAIDLRSIRALREGDQQRIAQLEAEAAALRAQIVKT